MKRKNFLRTLDVSTTSSIFPTDVLFSFYEENTDKSNIDEKNPLEAGYVNIPYIPFVMSKPIDVFNSTHENKEK